jgi:hypothetical protein
MYGTVARPPVQYGERQRPEHRSCGLLIKAQVADAPRTVPLAVPYTHLQFAQERISIACAGSTTGGAGTTGMKNRSNNSSFSLPRDPQGLQE